MNQRELSEQLEYDEVIKSLQVLLSHPHGKKVIKHLFQSFDVGKAPPVGLTDRQLLEYVAFLRAGNSIYELCLTAAPELTGQLISEMMREKEKYEKKTFIDESNNGI